MFRLLNTHHGGANQDWINAFRVDGPENRVWRANFLHEGSIDDGGPYRESMENISAELQAGVISLLVKTPNHINGSGFLQECFEFNPQARSETELKLFNFLGVLLGFAVRSEQTFNFDLHPSVWKKIVGQPLDYETDLNTLDSISYNQIKGIREKALNKDLSEDEFKAAINYQNFSIFMGTGVPDKELIEGGNEKLVTKENFREYISLAIRAHLHKDALQMKHFLDGFHRILPVEVISTINWRYAEVRAMGERTIDVQVLKLHTTIANNITAEVQKWFWEVMEEMEEEDKRLYLKFVNGRSKLPTNMATLRYKHQITY
jgi:hypothetical protein